MKGQCQFAGNWIGTVIGKLCSDLIEFEGLEGFFVQGSLPVGLFAVAKSASTAALARMPNTTGAVSLER